MGEWENKNDKERGGKDTGPLIQVRQKQQVAGDERGRRGGTNPGGKTDKKN